MSLYRPECSAAIRHVEFLVTAVTLTVLTGKTVSPTAHSAESNDFHVSLRKMLKDIKG